LSYKKLENHKIIRTSFEFIFIIWKPVPAPNPMGMARGWKKSLRLLNGDGDEKALHGGGSRPVAIPTYFLLPKIGCL
jgi:hypothetical protein